MRIFWKLGACSTLAAALACGTEKSTDEPAEINHEKEGAVESALAAGWLTVASTSESEHPLADRVKKDFVVDAPDTTRKFRIRFSTINLENGYDYLIVKDESGQQIERLTGRHRNFVTRTIYGKKATVSVETDASVQSWGFRIDQIRHRGCEHNNPGDLALRRSNDCTTLRDGIRELAIAEVRKRFTDGHFGGPIIFRANTRAEAAAPAAPAHSETNTQVAGVDEADIVKTDGNRIFSIAGRQLRIFRSWPAADTELLSATDIEGFAKELFLDGNQVVVFSGVQGDGGFNPGPIGPGGPLVRLAPIWWRPEAFTKVTVLDVSGAQPRVVSETLLAGQYETARKVQSSVRVVIRRQLNWPNLVYYPENVEPNTPEFDRAMDALEADAVRIVSERALADWLPKSYRLESGQRQLIPTTCGDFLLPKGSDEIGLTSVVTVQLGGARPAIQDTSLLVQTNQVYQSTDNLFLTTDHRWSCWEDASEEGQFTYVHKLDVREPTRATYLASGGIRGTIADQFRMDEHRGFLRIASTNSRWNQTDPRDRTSTKVYVLGQTGSRLNVVGETPEMAPGETLFGTRFVEDKGFVVTYEQIDPLFTLDLSNPRDPVILGKLYVPGFSTYLHVLDSQHLFTIGQDFEPDGRTRNGVALSIFNVADLRAPRLVHKAVVGSTSGNSEALYEHKAFSIYQEPGRSDYVLAIPFTDWTPTTNGNYWDTFKSSLKVFRVSPAGILGLGEIDHTDLFRGNDANQWGWWYQPNIRRGLFVDHFVYAISDAGLRVHGIDTIGTLVAEVAAQPQYENPAPTPTRVALAARGRPGLAIPDAVAAGVSTTLDLADEATITSLSVDLEIRHTYRGDLVVTLEHNGVTEILHNKAGGSTDDLIRNFITERFAGQDARGRWTLTVADTARADIGTLVSWGLTGEGTPGAGGPTTGTEITQTFSNNRAVNVPDANPRGVSSEIQVPDGISIAELSLEVNITHTYRGDLKVELEHDGRSVTLHDQTGGSVDHLRTTFGVSDFEGVDARGSWILRVSDHAAADVGQLDSWKLTVTGRTI